MTKEKAMQLAMKAHQGQTRKTTGTPMVEHPIRVASTLEAHGFSDEVVMAAYLHDTVEDTDLTIDDIRFEFGDKVAEIVAGNTENKEHSWEERKQHTLDWIQVAPLEVKALIVADKWDNLRSVMEAHRTQGEAVWSHFKRGKDHQRWYFEGVARGMTTGVDSNDVPNFFHLYAADVAHFFST